VPICRFRVFAKEVKFIHTDKAAHCLINRNLDGLCGVPAKKRPHQISQGVCYKLRKVQPRLISDQSDQLLSMLGRDRFKTTVGSLFGCALGWLSEYGVTGPMTLTIIDCSSASFASMKTARTPSGLWGSSTWSVPVERVFQMASTWD
jgi:hypothetical protein